MKLVVFFNGLGIGGTEKAACHWARGLQARGHQVTVLALADGPRRTELESHGVPVKILPVGAAEIAGELIELAPDAIHAHVPGFSHPGDVLGEALKRLPSKIPVVQTNVFGRLDNPREDAWTDLRLFVSWTSCVQAARRSFQKLDENFFHHTSVAVNPLEADDGPPAERVADFRRGHGILPEEVVFGHLGRPDPIRWDRMPIDAFRRALRLNGRIKLLLREPPPALAAELRSGPDADRFLILPTTSDPEELRLTTAAMDGVLHYSKVGESFGYGIAEPMNLGKPAIVNSTPWQAQAQIELARHGECGFTASTPATMAEAIVKLASDPSLRQRLGRQAQHHIRTLADPQTSLLRLETMLRAAVEKRPNPRATDDLIKARDTARYLDAHQFGHSWGEQLTLRPFYYRVHFHEFRKSFKTD